MKKLVSLFMIFMIIISIVSASNVSGAELENYQYQILENDTIKITKYSGSDEVLKIPEEIDGKKVTVLGRYSFEWSENLTEIQFPDTIVKLEEGVFYSCKKLAQVTFGKNIKEMGQGVFSGCESLKKVTLNKKLKEIPDNAFIYCDNLETIEIPDNITKIGNSAFYRCNALTSPPMGENVKTIGSWAFSECRSIKTIDLPKSVTTIRQHAFAHCGSLKKVTIPVNVKKIYNNTFQGCYRLKTVSFNAKDCDFLMYDNEYEYNTEVFLGCTKLEKMIIGDTVEKLPYDFFKEIIGTVKEVKICNDMKNISYKSIDGYKDLKVNNATFDKIAKGKKNGDILLNGYGKAKVRMNRYSGKFITVFNIVPRRVKTKNITVKKQGKTAVIKLKDSRKLSFSGKISTNENFKKSTKATYKNKSFTFKNLKKGRTYYFRVRAYTKVNGKKIQSNPKTIKFKF